MKVIFDVTAYGEPFWEHWRGEWPGGSEEAVMTIAQATRRLGDDVSLVHGGKEEQRLDGLSFLPVGKAPRYADLVVLCENPGNMGYFRAPQYIALHTSGSGLFVGTEPDTHHVVFSKFQWDNMCRHLPLLASEPYSVIAIGIHTEDYPYEMLSQKVRGRVLWCSSPDRGLWLWSSHYWEMLKKEVPWATLHVTYDFNGLLDRLRFLCDHEAQQLYEFREWAKGRDDVVILPRLSRKEFLKEQAEAQVFPYLYCPMGAGTECYPQAVVECAAAGCVPIACDWECMGEIMAGGLGVVTPNDDHYIGVTQAAIGLLKDDGLYRRQQGKSRKAAMKQGRAVFLDAWVKLLRELHNASHKQEAVGSPA